MLTIYCLGGFDSAGQISSEIENSDINSPLAIIKSISYSIVISFIFLITVLYHLGGESDHYIKKLIKS